MSYSNFANKSRSEKVVLAIAEAVHQVKLFELHAGSVYKRVVEHFVKAVKVNGVELTEVFTSSLSAGQFYFDAKAKTVYVRCSDNANPKTHQVALVYKFFFSNGPHVLPHDLSTGEPVMFEPRIINIGSLGQQLDDQNTGIVLESSSTITMENSDGFWDEIFDTLIWENQAISFYSWSPSIPVIESHKLFEGLIESKDFSISQVLFKVKDFVFKLKNAVNLPEYSQADGKLSPSHLGKPKRRIYGQVKQIQCVGIDKVLNGFPLTGTVTALVDSTTLTGSSTSFLSELSPGDELFFTINGQSVKLGIDEVLSNTEAKLGSKSNFNIVAMSAIVTPTRPYRKYNRRWSIAGHKLRAPSATITSIEGNNRVTANTVLDFFADDSVKINNEYVYVRRISGNKFVFNTALVPLPQVGDLIEKNPVSRAYFKNKEIFIDRDWSLFNTGEAILELNDEAEFNIAEQRSIGVNLTFTASSRTVTTTATVDLRTILQTRDWIRKDSLLEPEWYEVLDVREQTITLRTPFIGTTQTTTGIMKNVDLIGDESLLTVDCMGMEVDGAWIKTPSDAIRHLVLNDALFPSVNEDTFSKAKAECDYILSLPIPISIGDKSPMIKDVITLINESVFGSLYGDSSWAISYSILNSKKPAALEVLRDDDILAFDVVSDQKIINSIKVNYRPFTDYFNGSPAFETYSQESDFVNRFIGIKNSEEKTLYLYEEDKAKIIAQRLMFFKSLSTCKVQVKAKLNLHHLTVNSKVFLDLSRLFKRYGGMDRRKIGNVTAIKKNGSDIDVDFTDLGNIYNRVPSIAPNDASDYASASRDEVAKWGYVLDNQTLTPDVSSEMELGNNLIG